MLTPDEKFKLATIKARAENNAGWSSEENLLWVISKLEEADLANVQHAKRVKELRRLFADRD